MRLLALFFLVLSIATGAVAQGEVVSISSIQGTEDVSPKEGSKVTTTGIVTGIRQTGFYIQTPDDKVDDDPKTSEGVYVFTKDEPPKNLKIGDSVEVNGTVAEFRPDRERFALFLTEIIEPKVKVLESGKALPAAIVISNENLKPDGKPDQLERFEGMRVKVNKMTVVAPTGGRVDKDLQKVVSDGVFFGVVDGTPRPFREG